MTVDITNGKINKATTISATSHQIPRTYFTLICPKLTNAHAAHAENRGQIFFAKKAQKGEAK